MGIPLVVEPVEFEERPIDGYRIHESDYYLRDPGLEPDELAALNLALSAVRLDGVQGVEALWKLGGVVTDTTDTDSDRPWRRCRRTRHSCRSSAASSTAAPPPSAIRAPSARSNGPSSPTGSISGGAAGT